MTVPAPLPAPAPAPVTAPARPAPAPAPRIAPLPPEHWTPSLRAVLAASHADGPGRVNLFGTLAHHPPVAHAWLALAQVLTQQGTLTARDRELALLRTAHRLDCGYIWHRHAARAPHAGLAPAETQATREPLRQHRWSPVDLAVLRAADELVLGTELSDATWRDLTERLREAQLVELVVLVGQCTMICMLLRTLGTPSDDATADVAGGPA